MITDTSLPRLPRSAPETQGVSSEALLGFVDALDRCEEEVHSLLLVRHGHVILEGGWHPYGPDLPRLANSVSKSFTSAAVGIAVAEGRLSVDDKVVSFFPDDAPSAPDKHLSAMSVGHLLTMSSGHDADTLGPIREAADGNWVRAFLELPVVHEPGTRFVYNSGATYMLSAIVQKVTGQTLFEYAQSRLFAPLGIEGVSWESCPCGRTVGGWGLSASAEHFAKLGLLYLNGGEWNGRRIVPASWVEASAKSQIASGDDPDNDWAQGYGYQFWRCRHGAYRGDGAFGQFVIVMPEQDAVLALTGRGDDMQAVLNVVWSQLLPALDAAGEAREADEAAIRALDDRMSSLRIPPPTGIAQPAHAADLNGVRFALSANPIGLEELELRFGADECQFKWSGAGREFIARGGLESWLPNRLTLRAGLQLSVMSGHWRDERTYMLTMRQVEKAFLETYVCHLPKTGEDRLTVEYTCQHTLFPPFAFTIIGTRI